jgi:ribosomal protein S18 acetylase RimI-like enzyme
MQVVEDGLLIRSVTPEDADQVLAFLERLSPDSRWLRYHTGVPKVRPWMVDAVVSSDHVHHDALLAFAGERLVGVAEWGRLEEDSNVADSGIVVDECCRRRGIARLLLKHLAKDARRHGIDTFEAHVLTTNRPMVALMQQVAPVRDVTFDGPTLAITIPLRASA